MGISSHIDEKAQMGVLQIFTTLQCNTINVDINAEVTLVALAIKLRWSHRND